MRIFRGRQCSEINVHFYNEKPIGFHTPKVGPPTISRPDRLRGVTRPQVHTQAFFFLRADDGLHWRGLYRFEDMPTTMPSIFVPNSTNTWGKVRRELKRKAHGFREANLTACGPRPLSMRQVAIAKTNSLHDFQNIFQ